jgi:hypothetical protein
MKKYTNWILGAAILAAFICLLKILGSLYAAYVLSDLSEDLAGINATAFDPAIKVNLENSAEFVMVFIFQIFIIFYATRLKKINKQMLIL